MHRLIQIIFFICLSRRILIYDPSQAFLFRASPDFSQKSTGQYLALDFLESINPTDLYALAISSEQK